jgi:hypothetical protein
MSTVATDQFLVDAEASNFAFHAGQLLWGLLIDRGIELAGQAGSRVVTMELVENSLDRALLDRLLVLLREKPHGGSAGAKRLSDARSREAA